MRARSAQLGLVAALVALWGPAAGCFGDWVKAKPHPRREELPRVEAAPKEDPGPPLPCRAYRAEIGEVCAGLLEGRVETAHCYSEVLKLSAKPAIDGEEVDPGDGLTARQRSCRADYRGLVAQRGRGEPRHIAELGPQCRAFAERLRTLCLRPLAQPDTQLPTRCGSWLMTLQSIVRGRADRRESSCTRSLANLQAREDDEPTGGDTGGETGRQGP